MKYRFSEIAPDHGFGDIQEESTPTTDLEVMLAYLRNKHISAFVENSNGDNPYDGSVFEMSSIDRHTPSITRFVLSTCLWATLNDAMRINGFLPVTPRDYRGIARVVDNWCSGIKEASEIRYFIEDTETQYAGVADLSFSTGAPDDHSLTVVPSFVNISQSPDTVRAGFSTRAFGALFKIVDDVAGSRDFNFHRITWDALISDRNIGSESLVQRLGFQKGDKPVGDSPLIMGGKNFQWVKSLEI